MSIIESKDSQQYITNSSILQIKALNNDLFVALDDDGRIWIQQKQQEFTQFYKSSTSQITCFDLIVSFKEGFTTLAVGNADGDIEYINRGGSIQNKMKEAHKGSIVFMRFANDSQTLVSSCTQNCVRLWSKQGLLRSEIYKGDAPHYAIAWSPDDQTIILGGSKILTYKSIKPGLKDLVVRACDSGSVLCVKWAKLDNIIFSTHEDCKFSLWDQMGRNLFQSKRYDLPFSSGVWLTNSTHFVLANQAQILLVSKQGQIINDIPNVPQFYSLTMSQQTNRIYLGTTQGHLQEYKVNVFQEIQYKNIKINFQDSNQIILHDINTDQDYYVELENQILNIEPFQDKIFIITNNNCYIYSLDNLVTPVIFQVNKEPIIFHKISNNNIALVHQETPPKAFIYSHLGKQINQYKFSTQSINNSTFVINDEMFAEIDQANQKILKLTDSNKNKDYAKYEHENELVKIASNNIQERSQRKYLLLDSNKDLFLYQVSKNKAIKIASMVNSFKWHEQIDIFAFTQQSKLQIYYQPDAAFLDQELLELTINKIDLNERYTIDQIYGAIITLRTAQRKKQVEQLSQLAVLILKIFENKNENMEDKINKSLKLARFLKDELVWGILGVYSLENRDTNTAEICMSELDCVEKIFYLCKINNEEDDVIAQAMLLKLINKSKESESLLLRQKKLYEAVQNLTENFQFRRALKIVSKLKEKHQKLAWLEEFVIFSRAQYLEKLDLTSEYDELFKDKKTNKDSEDFKRLKESLEQVKQFQKIYQIKIQIKYNYINKIILIHQMVYFIKNDQAMVIKIMLQFLNYLKIIFLLQNQNFYQDNPIYNTLQIQIQIINLHKFFLFFKYQKQIHRIHLIFNSIPNLQ